MFYKVTLGFTTGATYNMTNVHVFKAAQARRAYFFFFFLLRKSECNATFSVSSDFTFMQIEEVTDIYSFVVVNQNLEWTD